MKPTMYLICGMPSEAIKLNCHSVQFCVIKSSREQHVGHMEKQEIFAEVWFENLMRR
jgi:hypothetical protein